MVEELSIRRLIKRIKEAAGEFPDLRTGQNTQYGMEDAAMGAFSVFFTQSPSFLAYQQEMKRNKGLDPGEQPRRENLFRDLVGNYLQTVNEPN
jgi:hypothetical protein